MKKIKITELVFEVTNKLINNVDTKFAKINNMEVAG